MQQTEAKKNNSYDAMKHYNLLQALRNNPTLQSINSFLRAKSKFYIFLKSIFGGDVSLNNFLYDLQFYSNDVDFEEKVGILSYINDKLKENHIDFHRVTRIGSLFG